MTAEKEKDTRRRASYFRTQSWETSAMLLAEIDAERTAHSQTLADLRAAQQTIAELREKMWDEESVQCGNCSAQIMARRSSLEGNVGLSEPEGEEELLCGHCAGLELADLKKRLEQAHNLAANQLAEPVDHEFDTGTLVAIATVLEGGAAAGVDPQVKL